MARRKLPRDPQEGWVRTGGAIGDPTMNELDAYNCDGADVDPIEIKVDGDPNIYLKIKRMPGSES